MYDEPDTNITTLVLEMPGVSKEELDISLFEGVLTVSCTSPTGAPTPEAVSPLGRFYHTRERPQGKMARTVAMPAGTKVCHAYRSVSTGSAWGLMVVSVFVQREDLNANMERGLLTIKFPMASSRKPEKIALVSAE